MPPLISIFELGVDEAHALLVGRFAQRDLPPLEAIENEDWGRDLLLTRLMELPPEQLRAAGLVARPGDDDGARP